MTQRSIVNFLQFQLPAIAWAIFIFTVSSIPASRIPHFISYTDKIVHASVFFILCWLTHVAFHFQPNKTLRKYALAIAIFFVVVYGGSDEYHQFYTPGRSLDAMDLLADAIGGFLYFVIYLRLRFYEDKFVPTA
ncbi:MAG: VanZ family protein [Bacteroidetes bacterium]|nr:VanZ family protein [Bacteroidota bacterium]